MVTPDVKRDAVVHVCSQHGVSQRRACEVLSVDRSSMRYRSVRPDDAAIREAMKKVASERRRFVSAHYVPLERPDALNAILRNVIAEHQP